MMDKSLYSLGILGSLAEIMYHEPTYNPVKICTKAKGNKLNYGKKCKHGGSCDGTKKCRFAIY